MQTFDQLTKLQENVDYELIPSEGENWDVRLLQGDFPETVIAFNKLQVSDDGEHMKFNFDLVSTPDPDLNEDSYELQKHVADVLNSILENAVTTLENKQE